MRVSCGTSRLIAALCCLQTPAVFVSKFKSAASFSTKSCQLSVNTTDHFSKLLYSGGEDVTYSSVEDFMSALTSGSFALGMLPTQSFVPVRTHYWFSLVYDLGCDRYRQHGLCCVAASQLMIVAGLMHMYRVFVLVTCVCAVATFVQMKLLAFGTMVAIWQTHINSLPHRAALIPQQVLQTLHD